MMSTCVLSVRVYVCYSFGVVGSFLAGKALTDQLKSTPGSSSSAPRVVDSIFTKLAEVQDFLDGVVRVL